MNHTAVTSPVRDLLPHLAKRIVTIQYDSSPELAEKWGEEGFRTSIRDMEYHLEYLTEAYKLGDPTLFVDYIRWTAKVLRNHGLPPGVLVRTLALTKRVLAEELEAGTVAPLIDLLEAGRVEAERPQPADDSYIRSDQPCGELLAEYNEALLRADRETASRLILSAVEEGVSIKDLYLRVFQPSQYEIGRLWMTNAISVAEEHYCTAATQMIMSQLYPRIFSSRRRGLRLLACCVGGELHEIGMRMVSDFFELEGWDTYYLGANTPPATIGEYIESREPHLVGFSMTLSKHRRLLDRMVALVKQKAPGVPIIAGGYALITQPSIATEAGIDGFAPDAEAAVELGERLVGAVGES